VNVEPIRERDYANVAEIYNYYVAHTIVTFEEAPIPAAEIGRRAAAVAAAGLPWFVARDAGAVVGFAYATPWKDRSAYRFAVECTVYVSHTQPRRGIGTALYEALFEALRSGGQVHVVLGGIALPNDASIALHEKFGMEKVGQLREVGLKFGRWIDVGYWERMLKIDEEPNT
jgi:phosphinothricin acetyltransferase